MKPMPANHEAGCDAIKRAVDAEVLAGAWRAFNAAEAMSKILAWYTDETQAWHDDSEKLRIILQERSEGP
jgi:hypothetical protein